MYGTLDIVCAALSNVVIEAGRYSATESGAAPMPVPVLVAVPSSVIGALSGRIESRLPLAFGSLLVAADGLLALRVDVLVEYWTTAVSALVVVAVGTRGVTAPLTSVVRGSVDRHHLGSASDLNGAPARTAGLVVTALPGFVLSAVGVALLRAFHLAKGLAAVACVAAAACAFALVPLRPRPPPPA